MFFRYETKFQLDNGVWVFPPTDEGRHRGYEIVEQVRSRWTPPSYYHHLIRGGHIKTIFDHLQSDVFCVVDIKAFFQSTTRSMIIRSLKQLGFRFRSAIAMATDSTVVHTGACRRRVLPYGFVQSASLATLCLDNSRIGHVFRMLEASDLVFSVYMDDITVSGRGEQRDELRRAFADLVGAFCQSPYSINEDKTQPPSPNVRLFNAHLAHRQVRVAADRMERFKDALVGNENPHSISAILRYVDCLNPQQADELEHFLQDRAD